MDIIPGTNYKILQSESHFKFGVDSVILSSFAKMKKGKTIIDIGTGVGILALRCHYLYKPSYCYAFEIQKTLAYLAEKSVEINKIENIEIINKDIREGFDKEVDYIITNPPYIEVGRGIENINPAKHIAFHECCLNLDDIFSFVKKNLKFRGRLFMVNRISRLVDVMEISRKYGIEPHRLRLVSSFSEDKPYLFMAEFIKGGGKNFLVEKNLVIYNDDKTYTKELMDTYYG